MANPKIGDIIEIGTCRGFVYAQYTHKNKLMGQLLHVLEGFHDKRPTNLASLVNGKTRFWKFFPLGAAVRRGIFEIVGNAPIPESAQSFPIFRSGTPDPSTKIIATWWLWDGEKSWRVGKLTPEQYAYPLREIWNDTFLITSLETDWREEDQGF